MVLFLLFGPSAISLVPYSKGQDVYVESVVGSLREQYEVVRPSVVMCRRGVKGISDSKAKIQKM